VDGDDGGDCYKSMAQAWSQTLNEHNLGVVGEFSEGRHEIIVC